MARDEGQNAPARHPAGLDGVSNAMKKWLTALAMAVLVVGVAPLGWSVAASTIPGATNAPAPEVAPDEVPDQTGADLTAKDAVRFTQTNGPAGGAMSVIELSPLYPIDFTIFAANSFGGFYRSTDDGVTWSQMNEGLEASLDIRDIAATNSYPRDFTIFLATSAGVYRSVDGGSTWELKNGSDDGAITTTNARTVAVSPAFQSDRTVFVGTSGGGVFRSTDGGETWQAYNQGLVDRSISALAVSAAYTKDCAVFAGSGGGSTVEGGTGGTGVFKVDCNDQWTNISEVPGTGPLTNVWVTDIAVVPFYGLAGCPYRIEQPNGRYTPGGCWNGWFVAAATAYNGVYIGMTDPEPTDASVWTWARIDNRTPGFSGREAVGLAISPDFANEKRIIATSRNGGAVGDFGISYTKDISGTLTSEVSPSTGWYDAANQTTTGRPLNEDIRSVAMAPDFLNNRALWAAAWGNLPYKGTAAPQGTYAEPSISWQDKADQQSNVFSYVWSVAAAGLPVSPTTMFAGTWGNGLHRSTDGGNNWTRVAFNPNYAFVSGNSRVPAADQNDVRSVILSPNYTSDGTVLGGTFGQGLLRSTDSGSTWTVIQPTTSAGQQLDPFFRSLAVPPTFNNSSANRLLLGGTRGGGLLRSASGGDPGTWEAINGGLGGDSLSIRSIAVSPSFNTDTTAFIGTDGGLFKSNNVNHPNRLLVGWTGTGNQGTQSPIILQTVEGYSAGENVPPPPGDDINRNGLTGAVDQGSRGSLSGKVLNIVTSVGLSPTYNDQATPTGGANTTVFASVWGSGIYRSKDKGATWTSLTRNQPGFGTALDLTRSIVLSPFYGRGGDQTLYAATFDEGIWVSTDDGATWSEFAGGTLPWIDQQDIASLAVTPTGVSGNPNEYTVFAGTSGRGVYSFTDSKVPQAFLPRLFRSRAD